MHTLSLSSCFRHGGHVEIKACDRGRDSDQACFDQNVLTFVEDVSHSMPADLSYPERAYLAPGPSKYEMKFQLPANFAGEKVLFQVSFLSTFCGSMNPEFKKKN